DTNRSVDADAEEPPRVGQHHRRAAKEDRAELVERLRDPAEAAERAHEDRLERDRHIPSHGDDEQRADRGGHSDREEIRESFAGEASRRHRVPAMSAPIRYPSKSPRERMARVRPRYITTIRSQSWSNSSRSSEISSTPAPSRANSTTRLRTKDVARTSRPRVGFMATSTTARVRAASAIARATTSFWMFPPDSFTARASLSLAWIPNSVIERRASSRATAGSNRGPANA